MHSRTEINEERYARFTKGFSKILLKNVCILNEHSGIIAENHCWNHCRNVRFSVKLIMNVGQFELQVLRVASV